MSRCRLRCELSSILDEGLFITIPNRSHAHLALLPSWRWSTLQNKCRGPFLLCQLKTLLEWKREFFYLLTRPILSGFFLWNFSWLWGVQTSSFGLKIRFFFKNCTNFKWSKKRSEHQTIFTSAYGFLFIYALKRWRNTFTNDQHTCFTVPMSVWDKV